MTQPHDLTTADELVALLGEPMDFVKAKVAATIDDAAAAFIDDSPLLTIATADSAGNLDVSPKGDAPGFVEVLDASTLLIPDRLGNRLAMGFHNILETGMVGLIFFVPTLRETLRVNGRATLSTDPEILDRLSAKGRPALLATRVDIDECFFHCGKALIRSKLWDPTTWPSDSPSHMVEQAAVAFNATDSDGKAAIGKVFEDNYRDELY